MRSRFDQSRKSTEDSDNEEIVYRGHPSRKALGLSTQWQYRRADRSQTDDAKNFQPRMAPIGVDAQKAENFRKFYRAVVSPTHVRVTAGGRIVPNSRAPAQPVFVWNKDRVAFDTVASSTDAAAQLNGESHTSAKKFQSMGSSFDSTGQTSSRSSYQKSDSSATAQSLESKDAAAQFSVAGSMPQPQAASQGVKFSPPDNFDPNRPFLINGQIVVPLPKDFKFQSGMPVVPLSMIGNAGQQQVPYQQQQQMMGAFHSTAPAFAAPQNRNQHLMPGMVGPPAYSYQAPRQFPVGSQVSDISGSRLQHHKSTPAMGNTAYRMDRLSPKALNQQMKSLQEEIENIDHQLTYNKHQTDENHQNRKRQYILQQIAQIKEDLAAFGFAPILQQPRTSVQDRRGAAVAVKALDLVNPSDGHDSLAEPEDIYGSYSTRLNPQVALRETAFESISRSATSTAASALHTSGTTPGILAAPVTIDSKPASLSKKRLSSSAAKAPEFKPRSQLAAESVNKKPVVIADDSLTIFKTPVKGGMDAKVAAQAFVPVNGFDVNVTMEETEARLISYSEDLACTSARSCEMLFSGMHAADLPSASVSEPGFGSYQNAMAAASSVAYQQAPLSLQNSAISNVGPYLSGYIQPGLHEAGTKDQQFNYSRPLTESELLARKLYWGNGGKQHQQKGLPKFDGKDFYPPSPTKPSTALVSQSRSSETSTVVRKYNSSAVTSKASEESGVLQKLDEEDTPVTPRMNQINRRASAPAIEQKKTDENKENIEIIKDTEDLDAWCAKNDIHMPDGGTPITRTKTASLLAKLANIPSPKFRLAKDSKPVSIAASERSDSYALPKLLARGASKPVAAACDEFATAKPSASTQMSAMSGIAKFQVTTPAVIDALQVLPFQGDQKKPASKSTRSVSGSVPSASVFDSAMGTFAGPAAGRTDFAVKAGELDVNDRIEIPLGPTAATEYLQKVARNDARRAQDTHGLEQQNVARMGQEGDESTTYAQSAVLFPQSGGGSMTATESLAAHQQSYLAKLPLHPRTVSGTGYVPPHQQSYLAKLPLHPVPPSVAAPPAPADQGPPVQLIQPQIPYPHPMQFPGQYHVWSGQPPFQFQMAPGPQYPVQMQSGQPQGQWIWHGTQGPPPAR